MSHNGSVRLLRSAVQVLMSEWIYCLFFIFRLNFTYALKLHTGTGPRIASAGRPLRIGRSAWPGGHRGVGLSFWSEENTLGKPSFLNRLTFWFGDCLGSLALDSAGLVADVDFVAFATADSNWRLLLTKGWTMWWLRDLVNQQIWKWWSQHESLFH